MKIEIYGKPNCAYCDQAKRVCELRQLEYTYLSLDQDYSFSELEAKVPNIRTFPAIFVNDAYVGGFNEFVKEIA